jgi:pyridoxine 5-phosphate synthase
MQRFPQVLLNVPVAHKRDVATVPASRRPSPVAEKALGSRGRASSCATPGTESLLRVMIEGERESEIADLAEAIAAAARRELGAPSGRRAAPEPAMTPRLGVNVDHVATLRQARGVDYPDPVEAALLAEQAGADGITGPPAEDRRHIQERDVEMLRRRLPRAAQPRDGRERGRGRGRAARAAARRVPRAREARGGDDRGRPRRRRPPRARGGGRRAPRRRRGIRVSLFVDPDRRSSRRARRPGGARGAAHGRLRERDARAAQRASSRACAAGATMAAQHGLAVHAGHGLTVANVGPVAALPEVEELNIGHSIVARAVLVGMAEAVAR